MGILAQTFNTVQHVQSIDAIENISDICSSDDVLADQPPDAAGVRKIDLGCVGFPTVFGVQRCTIRSRPCWGGIVPIAQLLPAGAFGPEAVKAMTTAFEETLRELELLDHNDPLTEIVARKIIEGARLGVRDPIRLRELAVARFPERKNSAVPRT